MTEEEYRNEMRRYGWDEAEISAKVAERNADSSECAVSLPFELYLSEKTLLRTYYIDTDGVLVDKEGFA